MSGRQSNGNLMTRRPDAGVAMVLLVCCGIFLRDLLNTDGSGAYVKTTTLPTLLVITMAVLSVLLLAGSLLAPAKKTGQAKRDATDRPRFDLVAALIVWVVLYIVALPWLGYLAASGLFLIGASWLYGNRHWGVMLALAILMPLALLLFFEKVMLILLPTSLVLG